MRHVLELPAGVSPPTGMGFDPREARCGERRRDRADRGLTCEFNPEDGSRDVSSAEIMSMEAMRQPYALLPTGIAPTKIGLSDGFSRNRPYR